MKLRSAPRDGRLGSQLVGKGWLIGVRSLFGQVAEWLKAAARKGLLCDAIRIGGSNPSPVRQTV
jgi:hypothetical protein